jgi:hypothetical protein
MSKVCEGLSGLKAHTGSRMKFGAVSGARSAFVFSTLDPMNMIRIKRYIKIMTVM